MALRADAFDGAAGSVYFGRAVQLNLALLVLPVAVWVSRQPAGRAGRRRRAGAGPSRGRPATSAVRLPSLYRLSIGRRPWAIANGAVVVSLIVALATSLAAFTASYDAAKVADARYANGVDIRITPEPDDLAAPTASAMPTLFRTAGVARSPPGHLRG